MMALAKGIAHISFPGGGTFLSVRGPYDRELLIEHVAHRVRAKGRVQVLIDDQRWLIDPVIGQRSGACAGCGHSVDAVCSTPDAGVAYCVRCAFAPPVEPAPAGDEQLQRVS
jgi:hypothetical protein